MGRRETVLSKMRSSWREVRLEEGLEGTEGHTAGGGKLVASENDEKQKQNKPTNKKRNKESYGGGKMQCNLNHKSTSSRLRKAFTVL